MTPNTDTVDNDAKAKRIRSETPGQIWLSRFTSLAPIWTLIALGIFFSFASPSFARPINLNNILAQISVLAIFGTGMTFVLLTGEIGIIALVGYLSKRRSL